MSGAEAAASFVETKLAEAEGRLANSADEATLRVGNTMADVEERMASSAETAAPARQRASSGGRGATRVARTASSPTPSRRCGKHIGDSTNDAARAIAANTRELNALMAEPFGGDQPHPRRDRAADRRQAQRAPTPTWSTRWRPPRSAPPTSCAPGNEALAEALANRTAETLAAVDGARNNLATGVSELIGRMSASSSKLGKLIEAAAENSEQGRRRTQLDHRTFRDDDAKRRALTFASSARLVDSNTSRLADLSSGTLRGSRLDRHAFRGAQPPARPAPRICSARAEQSRAHAGTPVDAGGPRRSAWSRSRKTSKTS